MKAGDTAKRVIFVSDLHILKVEGEGETTMGEEFKLISWLPLYDLIKSKTPFNMFYPPYKQKTIIIIPIHLYMG